MHYFLPHSRQQLLFPFFRDTRIGFLGILERLYFLSQLIFLLHPHRWDHRLLLALEQRAIDCLISLQGKGGRR